MLDTSVINHPQLIDGLCKLSFAETCNSRIEIHKAKGFRILCRAVHANLYARRTHNKVMRSYESNTRTPKEELLRKIAEVLDVNYRSLYEPTLYAAEDVMYTLFELDEHYPGTRLYEVTDTTDPDFPEKHMAVSFRYRLLDDFLKEWQLRKKQLRDGEITKEEYLEWKLNWPQTADGCGRYEPKKKWRKE